MNNPNLSPKLNASIDRLSDAIYQPLKDTMLKAEAKLALARKSLLSLCRVYEINLDEIGMVEVYARKSDFPKNPQTDETEMQWRVEAVMIKDELGNREEIKLDYGQEREVYDMLYNLKS